MIAVAMWALQDAARGNALATTCGAPWCDTPVRRLPALIMIEFLLRWQTIPILFMFMVFVVYARLAGTGEREVAARLGIVWRDSAAGAPGWVTWPRRLR